MKNSLLPLTPEIAEKLKLYAKRKFRAKKLETEFLINLNQRLSFSNEVLSHSLLKLNTNLNKLAVEINANLIKYLNHSINSPKSKKVKLIRECLVKASEFPELLDEVYLQVLKLTLHLTPVDLYVSILPFFLPSFLSPFLPSFLLSFLSCSLPFSPSLSRAIISLFQTYRPRMISSFYYFPYPRSQHYPCSYFFQACSFPFCLINSPPPLAFLSPFHPFPPPPCLASISTSPPSPFYLSAHLLILFSPYPLFFQGEFPSSTYSIPIIWTIMDIKWNKIKKRKIVRKTWEIFTMVAISYSSKDSKLFEIIKLYLEFQNLPIKNKDPQLDRFIKHSLSQIQRRSSLNLERTNLPSNQELLGIKEMKFFQPININTSKNNETILLDSCMTVKEVISTILGGYLYSIPPSNNFNNFSLYCQNNEKTFLVPLSSNAILADFIAEKHENPVKLFELGILVWNFNYQETLYCNLLELVFNTVASRFLNFDFELSITDAVKAAGLLFHANNLEIPNKQNVSHFFSNYSLSRSSTSPENLLQRILAESTLYEQCDPTRARVEFLKFTESLNVYQSSFFPVLV